MARDEQNGGNRHDDVAATAAEPERPREKRGTEEPQRVEAALERVCDDETGRTHRKDGRDTGIATESASQDDVREQQRSPDARERHPAQQYRQGNTRGHGTQRPDEQMKERRAAVRAVPQVGDHVNG